MPVQCSVYDSVFDTKPMHVCQHINLYHKSASEKTLKEPYLIHVIGFITFWAPSLKVNDTELN